VKSSLFFTVHGLSCGDDDGIKQGSDSQEDGEHLQQTSSLELARVSRGMSAHEPDEREGLVTTWLASSQQGHKSSVVSLTKRDALVQKKRKLARERQDTNN